MSLSDVSMCRCVDIRALVVRLFMHVCHVFVRYVIIC